MTWEADLFAVLDDLEGQAEGAFSVDRDLEVADRARAEYAAVTLAGRLMASTGDDVRLQVLGVGLVTGRLARVADGWLLVEAHGLEWIIRTATLGAAYGLSSRAVPPDAWPVTTRLGLGSALRRLAEEGTRCQVRLVDGSQYDVVPVRVGADFLEARTDARESTGLLAFASIAAVHSIAAG